MERGFRSIDCAAFHPALLRDSIPLISNQVIVVPFIDDPLRA